MFYGYVHDELSDEEFAAWSQDKDLMKLVERVRYHFFTAIASGEEKIYEYIMNWFSWLLRNGDEKIGVTIFLHSLQGSGKDLMINEFIGQGIIGSYAAICTALDRFVDKFSDHRIHKLLWTFNECSSQLERKSNWDKIKSIITDETF